MDGSIPFVCIDSYGGPFGPGSLYAHMAREIMGREMVFPVALKQDGSVSGLNALVQTVSSSFRSVLMMSAGIPRILPLLRALEQVGIVNDLTEKDRNIILNWPTVVKPEFTGRKIEVYPFSSVGSELLAGFAGEDGMIFAKTIVKKSAAHGTLIQEGDILQSSEKGLPVVNFSGDISYVPVQNDDSLIISQPIDIAEDDKGKIEYRSWIINHTLSCVSRYWRENTPLDNPDTDVLDFIGRFTSAHGSILPKHYVLDFARTTSGKLVVVELNFLPESVIAGDVDAKTAVLRKVFTSIRQG